MAYYLFDKAYRVAEGQTNGVPANRVYEIDQPESAPSSELASAPPAEPLFSEVSSLRLTVAESVRGLSEPLPTSIRAPLANGIGKRQYQ